MENISHATVSMFCVSSFVNKENLKKGLKYVHMHNNIYIMKTLVFMVVIIIKYKIQ